MGFKKQIGLCSCCPETEESFKQLGISSGRLHNRVKVTPHISEQEHVYYEL